MRWRSADAASSGPAAEPPPHGVLSGMIVTQAALCAALVTGALVSDAAQLFGPPSPELLDIFFWTLALMAAHKLESYLTHEFDVCPVYLNLGRAWARDVRRAAFTIFVLLVLAAALLLGLAMRGPPWPLLLLGVWCAQGLHELHHVAKTAARRRYYPGVVTAVLFTAAIDAYLVPAWTAHLPAHAALLRGAFYAAQPLLLVAFYLEDRRWLARGGRAFQPAG